MKHTNLWNEIEMEEPDNSNLIIGLALGVVIMICSVIYVVTSFLEAVSY